MTFDQIITAGIKNVYQYDLESQKHFINTICDTVRNMPPDIIYKAEGFFVPNGEYLVDYFGPEVHSPDFDFYNFEGECLWQNRLVLPLKDVAGTIKGLVGFDPFKYLEAHETNNWALGYYSYSTKKIFRKGAYFYCMEGTYKKALEDGYVIITDGVFDTLSFASCGLNSMAALGSVVTHEMAAQLRFVKKVLIAVDNDDAGIKFYNSFARYLNNVVFIGQSLFKDADDVLKSDYREVYLKEIKKAIDSDFYRPVQIATRNSFKINKLKSF